MGLLGDIERLINEHGSAAILRERLAFADAQFAALERQVADLTTENSALRLKASDLEAKAENLELANAKLEAQIRQIEGQANQYNNPQGYVCDHCGSPKLKRTGNRPDPMFGEMGVKQAVFTCFACNRESAFTP